MSWAKYGENRSSVKTSREICDKTENFKKGEQQLR